MRIRINAWYKIKRFLSKRRSSDFRKAKEFLSDDQTKILEITNYLISLPATDLTFSKLSETYFIEYDEVSCKIDDTKIVITNGLYSYEISLPGVIIVDIRDRFLRHIESRKNQVQKRINQKLSHTLSKVHEQILERAKKTNFETNS
jgi:hypothetical protein